MFKIEVIGNLGSDAEVKESNGSKFVAFRVAHTDKWTQENGEKREVTSWIDCTMSNTESKVLPYLKSGVKVYVRGNASLRVYSSAKDRMMKAGAQVSVSEVELCGGVAELVPRQLIEPETGALIDVNKFYWCNADTKGMKKTDTRTVIDAKGNQYKLDARGFVIPLSQVNSEAADASENNEQKQ